MKYVTLGLAVVSVMLTSGCSEKHTHSAAEHQHSHYQQALPAITQYFSDAVNVAPDLVSCTLTDGSESQCYLVTVPTKRDIGHQQGPWCPRNIKDDASNAGIWLKDNNVYDIDGQFIANLATFYDDDEWELYNPVTGEVKVTDSKKACLAAARPDVDEAYQNYCVECQPEYFEDEIAPQRYLIPAAPQQTDTTMGFDPHGGMGLAFNGVKMDAPAPIDAIIGAHTLAPFDDCGGHVNSHVGYHYHAITDCSSIATAMTDHGKILGVAFDGFAIFSQLLADGAIPDNLDSCGGHNEQGMGYHYHAADAGKNQILGCFVAPRGCAIQEDNYSCEAPARGRAGPGQRPQGPPPGEHPNGPPEQRPPDIH